MWDARQAGAIYEDAWQQKLAAYATVHPQLSQELERRMRGELPEELAENIRRLMARTHAKAATMATRKASQEAIEGIAPVLPELIGGSADLAGSNLTLMVRVAGRHQQEWWQLYLLRRA